MGPPFRGARSAVAATDQRLEMQLGNGLRSELLRDLNRVQRRSFEELVARDPESEAVIQGTIVTQPADLAVVALGAIKRQRVLVFPRLIHELDARRFGQNIARTVERHRLL